jgi:hypothetical protein
VIGQLTGQANELASDAAIGGYDAADSDDLHDIWDGAVILGTPTKENLRMVSFAARAEPAGEPLVVEIDAKATIRARGTPYSMPRA